ncbi:Proteophosphoglycan ppg4 [Rhodotorula toruloides]
MAPVLPLELQLLILELALPPPIRRNRDERVRLGKAFSLRDPFGHDKTKATERLEAKCAGALPFETLVIAFEPFDECQLSESPSYADYELGLRISSGDGEVRDIGSLGLQRLFILDLSDFGSEIRQLSHYLLPAQLRYLGLNSVLLSKNWDFNHFARLETLIFDQVDYYTPCLPRWVSQLKSLPLRALCCKVFFPALDFRHLADFASLKHFALVLSRLGCVSNGPADDSALVLPCGLQTFTFCGARGTTSKADDDLLNSVCQQNGTRFLRQEDVVGQEIFDWDPEEWAYSIGA